MTTEVRASRDARSPPMNILGPSHGMTLYSDRVDTPSDTLPEPFV
jgi:hypothetical protein